jgi:hypothetical protein
MSKSGKAAALALSLLMLISTLPLSVPSGSSPDTAPAGRATASADIWLTTDTYEKDIEIAKGERFFLSVGPDGNITPMDVPAPDTGMPPEILSALNRAPGWLRENLTDKFARLAATNIMAPVLAFGDFDSDGDPDVFGSLGDRDLTYFKNVGDPDFPRYIQLGELWTEISGPEPAAGDLTGNGQPELAVGDDGGLVHIVQFHAMINQSMDLSGNITYQAGRNPLVPSRACPTMGDLDGDGDLDMVVGDGLGKSYYFENVGSRTNWSFQKTANSLLFAPLAVPGPARPALADLDGDGDMDLAVGAGNGIIHYFRNIGTRNMPAWAPDDLLLFSGIKAASDAAPTFLKLDGDNRTDLVVGQGSGPALVYENIGTSTNPAWPTWPFYEYTPSVGYYDPKTYMTWLDFSGVASSYAMAIVSAEPRIVDELAFSIAHSAVEALRASNPGLYLENARSLYENDQYIDYAQIVDYADCSTIRYTVNESGRHVSYELPGDIYYWYIVHPRITDEMPTYIDPAQPSGSANETAPPPTGKFWRNYIFFNADNAYPPDPPTDLNGDGVPDFHYPGTMAPPLLKDLLAGVKTVWNCTPYNSPGGFDSAGINNSHPFDYGDHAIEKVSNWVMKTLPLNEQESGDGERPVQPVRLLHHHNGNCGELGDLTVAAARAALIPAVQVSMLAEDHVWIQFYERGWHQWDNYWSDGGAVVDNFMNYWVGWGLRGGSGISAWRGDDFEFDVTGNYIPPPSQSHITVNVRDAGGYPVDGARVVMMSHWMAESQQQQQELISYPFPAIWNFTDPDGSATFVLAHNNFTIEVVSKLGRAAVNKTYIGVGENRMFNLTLPGRLPYPAPRTSPFSSDVSGGMVMADIHSTDGEQRPPNPEVGTTSVQPILAGLGVDFLVMNRDNFSKYLSGQPAAMEVWSGGDFKPFEEISTNDTWFIVLSNERTLETSQKVHLKLEVSKIYHSPSVVIEYPANGTVVDAVRPVPATGIVLGGSEVDRLDLLVDGGPAQNITAGLDRATGRWRWDAALGALPSGRHQMTVAVVDMIGLANSSSVSVDLDRLSPSVSIDSPAGGSMFDLDTVLEIQGRAGDDMGVRTVQYRLDGGPTIDITGALDGQRWNFTVPGGHLGGGEHHIDVRAVDVVGRSATASVAFELRDGAPPKLSIASPVEGDAFEIGSTIVISGSARDDSGVARLLLTLDGRNIDIMPGLGMSGEWSYSIDTAGRDIGELSLDVTAIDGAGNRAAAGRTVRLVDTQAPHLSIELPADGSVVRSDERLNISGAASDNLGVRRLEIQPPQGSWKSVLGSLRDGKFLYSLDISGLPAGRYNVTVRAQDASGNTAVDQININVIGPDISRPKPNDGTAFIPGMGMAALLCALGMLAVMRRTTGPRV